MTYGIILRIAGRIHCSLDMCTIDYYWPKAIHDTQYEAAPTEVYCHAGAATSHAIESAISACIINDQDIFKLYETAVPLMSSTLTALPPQLSTLPSNPRTVSLSETEWVSLLTHADREVVFLPIFGNNFKTNQLLLKSLGQDLQKFSAVTVTTIPATATVMQGPMEGSGLTLKPRPSFSRNRAVETQSPGEITPYTVKGDTIPDRMVISYGNCLIFIELPRDSFILSLDSVKSSVSQRFDVLSADAILATAHDNKSDFSAQSDDMYFIDTVELDSESIDDKSEDFSKRLSSSSTAHDAEGRAHSPLRQGLPYPTVYESPSQSGVDVDRKTEYSKSCEVSLYYLQLPTFRFTDTVLRSNVAQAVVMSSTSRSGSFGDSTTPNLQIQADLKGFLLEAHMGNFTTSLCTAMKEGQAVTKEDIQLGLDRCYRSVYEVDISVMCRKRYLANQAVGLEMPGPSVGSLCSAFENSLGRLLEGLEKENVFVLCGDSEVPIIEEENIVDPPVEAVVTEVEEVGIIPPPLIQSKNKISVRVPKNSDASSRSKLPSSPSEESVGGVGSSSSSPRAPTLPAEVHIPASSGGLSPRIMDSIDNRLVDKIIMSGSGTVSTVPATGTGTGTGIGAGAAVGAVTASTRLPVRDRDTASRAADTAPNHSTTSTASTARNAGAQSIVKDRSSDPAIFVRFAVVSRTEKPPANYVQVQAQGQVQGPGQGQGSGQGSTVHQLGSSGSCQSLSTTISASNGHSSNQGVAGIYPSQSGGTPGDACNVQHRTVEHDVLEYNDVNFHTTFSCLLLHSLTLSGHYPLSYLLSSLFKLIFRARLVC